jgi:hypothetical protein
MVLQPAGVALEEAQRIIPARRTGFSPHRADAFPDIPGRYCCGVVVAGHTSQSGARTDRSE